MSSLCTFRICMPGPGVLRLFAALPWLLASAWVGAEPAVDSPWKPIKLNPDTTLQASGDVHASGGAHIVAEAHSGTSEQVAGAISSLDAQDLHGRRLVLSADLAAAAGTQGAALWLRADDADGRRVALANTQGFPLSGGEAPARREAALTVPGTAMRVSFGLLFTGQGRIEATRLRLQVAAAPADTAAPAVAPERLFDTAAALVRERAYYAERIDWDQAVAELRVSATKAKDAAEVHTQIRALLALLGDNHSFLMPAVPAQPSPRTAAATTQAEVKLLASDVGYVRIPAFASTDPQAQTQFARDAAVHIAAQAAAAHKGWIVDLRGNTGGNMWPMLAALRALLGEGVVGATRDRREQLREWHAGDYVAGLAADPGADLSAVRVAVLLDDRTASAGEAVAVAFHGRAGTRSFGSTTAGQSNANAAFPLPDGSRLALTVAVNLDRHGDLLSPRVEPDQTTAAGDATLAAALSWLGSEDAAAR